MRRNRCSKREKMIFGSMVSIVVFGLFCTCAFAQPYSLGPGQKGEEILDELLLGNSMFWVKVGSSGCTGKKSFRVDVGKQEGGAAAPHYTLTIHRVAADECKAMIGGIVISWDLEKDLGLTGSFTYSVRNRVYSVYQPADDGESLSSIVARRLGIAVPEKPKPRP